MRYLLFFLLLAVPCEAQIVRGDQFVFGTGALNTSRRLLTGAGSPESVVTAPIGSIYIRTDGGAGTSVYAKDSGAGNTGWVAVGRGTVSSVALSLPAFITVSGSPVTGAGTLTGTLASQTQNTFFAAPNGSDGTPTFRALVAADVPTLNQNTTGSAATWTTARLLAGNSVNGSANVPFANKFVVQGTADTGLSGAQFLGALGTGIVKNTMTTGVLSIAVAGDFPTLNQNTTGTAATVTGATQAAITSAANLATVGTITSGVWNAGAVTSSGAFTSSTSVALTGTTNNLGTITTGVWNAGAITAAGAITTNGLVTINRPAATLSQAMSMTGTTTSGLYSAITNTGGSFRFGIEGSTPNNLFVADAAYGSVLGTMNSTVLQFGVNASITATLDLTGSLQIGGTAARAGTAGTNRLDIFNGTAPTSTLANAISLYVTTGELRVMDAAGNATLLSPHDHDTNEWIFESANVVTGRRLRIDVERLLRVLDRQLGGGFIQETQ